MPGNRTSVARRRRLAGLVLFVVLLAAGCQVTTTVDVAVAPDGSGVVTVRATLDKVAAARLPDLDQSLLVRDLTAAGWKIDGPKTVPGGGWQVRASRPFANAAQLGAIMDQIAGPSGAFRDFSLTRSHSFAKTSYRLKGTVDLSGGIDAFGDPALRQALGGTMFGRTDAQLEQEIGQPAADALSFKVVTHLPGGATKDWSPRLGDEATTITADSSTRKPVAWLFVLAALLAAVGFVATVTAIARYNRIKAPPSYMHRPGGPRRPWDD